MKVTIDLNDLNDLDIILLRCRSLYEQNGPQTVTIQNIENSRSVLQNKLAFHWYKFIAMEMQDGTPDDKRAYCKLHHGVAILKNYGAFRVVYDEIIKPLTYEQKIICMKEPIDFPITSKMNVKEMTRYLDAVDMDFANQGIILPKKDDLYYAAMGVKKK